MTVFHQASILYWLYQVQEHSGVTMKPFFSPGTIVLLAATAALASTLAGCGPSMPPANSSAVSAITQATAAVTVSPPSATITPGATVQFSGVGGLAPYTYS